MRIVYFLFLSVFLLFGCKNPSKSNECEMEADPLLTDTISKVNGNDLLDADEKPKGLVKEKQENHAKIVKKYGEQWDFCTCVVAHDSINTVSQNNLGEKQLEKLMKRWEHIEIKCKEFITNPNKTPEERDLHEKKVKKCLSENK